MSPRPGSRKRQVYDHLQANGADAAERFGLTLGLKPGTIRSWISGWASAPAVTTRPSHHVEVYADDKDKETWEGVIVREGDQQSEVRLTSGPLTGYVRVIPNHCLTHA